MGLGAVGVAQHAKREESLGVGIVAAGVEGGRAHAVRGGGVDKQRI